MSDPAAGLSEALAQLPVFAGYSWRVAGFELKTPFTSDAVIPTSRSLRVATENFRAVSVHLFLATGARDISMFSAHPADQEVVLLPGARLVPASGLRELGGIRVQVVLDLPPQGQPIPAVPTDEEIIAWVQASREEPDVTVFSPRRFGA